MVKIWYRNPSKSGVFGRCGGDEKTNDYAEPTSRTLNKNINNSHWCSAFLFHGAYYWNVHSPVLQLYTVSMRVRFLNFAFGVVTLRVS